MFVAVFMAAIMIALFISFGTNLKLFGGGEGAITKTSLQSDIYTTGHALDAARIYMETSLDYSVYQACYDNLRKAGLSEITVSVDSYNELSGLTIDGLYNQLGTTIQTYLNRYSNENYAFMTNYRVTLPTSVVSITPAAAGFTVATTPTGMMTATNVVQSGESVTLRADASISRDYDIPFLSLINKASEMNPSLESDLQGAFTQALQAITIDTCTEDASCTRIVEDELTKSPKVNFPSPLNNQGFEITSELLEAEVNIDFIDRNAKVMTYKATAVQKVTITKEGTPLYPVWDGSRVTFDNMKLVYLNRVTS